MLRDAKMWGNLFISELVAQNTLTTTEWETMAIQLLYSRVASVWVMEVVVELNLEFHHSYRISPVDFG